MPIQLKGGTNLLGIATPVSFIPTIVNAEDVMLNATDFYIISTANDPCTTTLPLASEIKGRTLIIYANNLAGNNQVRILTSGSDSIRQGYSAAQIDAGRTAMMIFISDGISDWGVLYSGNVSFA